jgi:hypothetical protein
MTALEAAARAHADVVDRLERIERAQEEILRRLAEQSHSMEAEYLDSPALATALGITSAALRMRLRRGSDLASIALMLDGRRAWRRRDVDALVARRGNIDPHE